MGIGKPGKALTQVSTLYVCNVLCGEDPGLAPATFSVICVCVYKTYTYGSKVVLKALKAQRNISLQEGGCSVPVAVHTMMKDGQVSRENG